MGTKIYQGKPNGSFEKNFILGKYGMFEQDGQAIFNDLRTLIFMKDQKCPIILDGIHVLSREAVGKAVDNRFDKIESVRFSNEILAIGDGAFEGCTNLASFSGTDGNCLIGIGKDAFKNCTSLKTIDINTYNMIDVHPTAFENCQIKTLTCNANYDDLTDEDEEWASYITSRIMGNSSPDANLLGASIERPSRTEIQPVTAASLGIDVNPSDGFIQYKTFNIDELYSNPQYSNMLKYIQNDPYLGPALKLNNPALKPDNPNNLVPMAASQIPQRRLLGDGPYSFPDGVVVASIIIGEVIGGSIIAAACPPVGIGIALAGVVHACIVGFGVFGASQEMPGRGCSRNGMYSVYQPKNAKQPKMIIMGKCGFRDVPYFGNVPVISLQNN